MSPGSADEAPDRSGPWLLAGITLFWGLNFVTIKYSVEEVPIWTFRTICLLTGGFGLLGIAKALGLSLRVPRAEWRPLVIAAIGNITGWHIFSAWGLQYVPASRGTILAYTMPLFAAVISVLWLKQKMTGLIATALVSGLVALAILLVKWKDLMVAFFDENHARSVGLNPDRLKVLFFTLLSASTVAALQTVGAFLVIAMVVTPGATAYLLTDRFPRLIAISVAIGAGTSFVGAYASYFLDGATGGIIVVLQTAIFLAAFFLAPKHGMLAARRRAAEALEAAR